MSDLVDIEDIMPMRKSQVISVSRRTDIPAFYMKEFLSAMIKGYTMVKNPHNPTQQSKISLDPIDVKCIAWWSKDYKNWIIAYENNKEIFSRYKHYFNFTINSRSPLEKLSSSLDERLEQVKYLINNFGANSVQHRFDPIAYWNGPKGEVFNNINDYDYILSKTSLYGLIDVIFSFCIPFKKTVIRMNRANMPLIELGLDQQKMILDMLLEISLKYGITMRACSSDNLVGYCGFNGGRIEPSACIGADRIEYIIGERLHDRKKDKGQRELCNCVQSRDVGNYDWTCGHSCVYCYANPSK